MTVWRRGELRAVACFDDEDSTLVLEIRRHDALGNESWRPVGDDTGITHALLVEIVSRVESLPAWVREMVQRDLAALEAAARGFSDEQAS